MSKIKLYKEAENLYIEEGLSVDEICQNLDVARRTIFYWKKKYEWNKIQYGTDRYGNKIYETNFEKY